MIIAPGEHVKKGIFSEKVLKGGGGSDPRPLSNPQKKILQKIGAF